jgi:para-aminobenzoate synthetase component I
VSPAPHQAMLRLGGVSMVSASPETFLRLDRDGTLTTRPIKGTRPRGVDAQDDRRLITELLESEKEQAENLMIVDLMRNDLLQVCDEDSVRVTGLFEVETFSTVHQLVSTVTGTLTRGADGIDAIRACFPAGSMTGAPKSRAVSLLAGWEAGPRGLYSGAWGWLRPDFSLELAMTIRTAVLAEGVVRIGTGGGITWSSKVDEEIAEVGHKAKRLLEALGVSTIAYS